MPGVLRAIGERFGMRTGIALGVLLAIAASAPFILSSRFVKDRRAAHSLGRARSHLATGQAEEARVDLRAALRLQPWSAEARQRLAALELSQGNWELAVLELQSLTEVQPLEPEGLIRF